MVSKFNDLLGNQDTKVSQVPQERQVAEVGQDTEAIEDTKVSQVPQERQVTEVGQDTEAIEDTKVCLLYTSPSPRDGLLSRMPSSA